MTSRTMLSLAAALGLAACAAQQPQPNARLPYDAVIGAGDPLRSAVATTSTVFSSPDRLAGQPEQAARAVAQMEFVAVEMETNPRFTGEVSISPARYALARDEWRRALGIPAGMAPQRVIDSLYASARALGSGQTEAAAAALPPSVFPQGGAATLTRLAALPDLPLTNQAAVDANDTLRRQDGQGRGRF
jgi:hypothetical protein